MVIEVAGCGAEDGFRHAVFVQAGVAKTGVGRLVVVLEVEAMFDERSAREGVVADAVSAHPRIQQR